MISVSWEAVYIERCTYGFGARLWKPTLVTRQGAVVLAYNIQREELLPSEKAFAYKMKLDAMKKQGKRTDLTSGQNDQKLSGKVSRDLLAEEMGESSKQIQR